MKAIIFSTALVGKWHDNKCLVIGAILPEIGTEGWHSLIILDKGHLARAASYDVEIMDYEE